MSDKKMRDILGATVIVAGMVGLHFGVEYSGWVLFGGFLVLL